MYRSWRFPVPPHSARLPWAGLSRLAGGVFVAQLYLYPDTLSQLLLQLGNIFQAKYPTYMFYT